MKFKSILTALSALALSCGQMLLNEQVLAQATILPPGETCFQATTGINGMVGVLGTITGGSSYANGSYGGVPLTGGAGSGATANITVSAGSVTQVTVLNPGIQYVVGDVLSAAAANIGGSGSGFSVSIASTSINSSLAGGSVGFYIPNTQTFKQTWQNAGETVLNQNPVPLDQNGCAVIYGAGVYLMVVQDSLGNTVYTQLTASTSPQGIFFAGLAGGTGNAITITDTAFALQDGATIQFRALNANTGPATISVSGGAQIPIVIDTTSGPAALSGGEIDAFNMPIVSYDATNVEFHLVNPATSSSSGGGSTASLVPPQGYLNLVGQASGDIIQVGDVVGTGTIFYSPFTGGTLPIWNGSTFKIVTFSEMTATLTTAGSPISTIQDECVFSNNGVPTLVTGPSWTTVTAGAGNRGTGAGTPQLTRLQGIWVNAVSIIGYNGLSSYTIPANQCTYVGSISVDTTAGLVSAFRSYGISRKFGVWNAYNRQPIYLKAGDGNGGWNPTGTLGPVQGQTVNSLQIFSGLPEEVYDLKFFERGNAVSASSGVVVSLTSAIGFNSTTVASGYEALGSQITVGSVTAYTLGIANTASYFAPPALGINTITALEAGSGANVAGGESSNVLTAYWRG